MNPNTKMLTFKRCEICAFPHSDEHHLYPKSKGGRETITLCPNHHRLANIVQIWVRRCLEDALDYDIIYRAAEMNFDAKFRDILPSLISGYEIEEARTIDLLFNDLE